MYKQYISNCTVTQYIWVYTSTISQYFSVRTEIIEE